MQLLIDTPEFRKDLIRLRTFAVANILDLSKGEPENYVPPGDISDHVVMSGTTRVVYSVDKQPAGLFHHLSVSKLNKEPPNTAIVDYIMGLLGMGSLYDRADRDIHMENGYAISIMQECR